MNHIDVTVTAVHKQIDIKTCMRTDSWQDYNTAPTGTPSDVTLNFVTVPVPVVPRKYIPIADDRYPRIVGILSGRGRGEGGKGEVTEEMAGRDR